MAEKKPSQEVHIATPEEAAALLAEEKKKLEKLFEEEKEILPEPKPPESLTKKIPETPIAKSPSEGVSLKDLKDEFKEAENLLSEGKITPEEFRKKLAGHPEKMTDLVSPGEIKNSKKIAEQVASDAEKKMAEKAKESGGSDVLESKKTEPAAESAKETVKASETDIYPLEKEPEIKTVGEDFIPPEDFLFTEDELKDLVEDGKEPPKNVFVKESPAKEKSPSEGFSFADLEKEINDAEDQLNEGNITPDEFRKRLAKHPEKMVDILSPEGVECLKKYIEEIAVKAEEKSGKSSEKFQEAEKKFDRAIAEKRIPKKEKYVAMWEDLLLNNKEWRERKWKQIYREAVEMLTEEQKKEFNSLRFNHKVLDVQQVEYLFVSGMSLEDIKEIKYEHWWSRKIISKLRKEPVLEDSFDKLVDEEIQRKFREEARKEIEIIWEKKRQFIVEEEAKAGIKQKLEQKKIHLKEMRQKKIEAADNLSPEQRYEKLKEMSEKYKNIKACYKGFKALESGKVAKKGDKILGSVSSWNEIASLLHRYSDDMVKLAEDLTGENVLRDALVSAGIDPKMGPQNNEERLKFRRQLTKNIKAIFKEQVEKTNKDFEKSGSSKKITRKDKKKAPSIAGKEELEPGGEGSEKNESKDGFVVNQDVVSSIDIEGNIYRGVLRKVGEHAEIYDNELGVLTMSWENFIELQKESQEIESAKNEIKQQEQSYKDLEAKWSDWLSGALKFYNIPINDFREMLFGEGADQSWKNSWSSEDIEEIRKLLERKIFE